MIAQVPMPIRDKIVADIPFPSRFGTAKEFAARVEHIYVSPMLNGSVIRLDGAARLA